MAKRHRKKQVDIALLENPVEKSDSQVTFDAFFNRCVFDGRLKDWQRKEILAFFQDKNLKEKENLELYESTLALY